MNPVISLLVRERKRFAKELKDLESSLLDLPKGSVQRKRRGAKEYFYLTFKENGKVVSRYLPRDDVDSMERNVERRRAIEKNVGEIRDGIALLERALRGAVK